MAAQGRLHFCVAARPGHPRDRARARAGTDFRATTPRSGRSSAFTLLEVLLAVFLLVMMTAAMFSFYSVTLRTRDRGKRAVEGTQLARAVAYRMAREIRGAGGEFQTLGPGIYGGEHEITIHTVVLPDQTLFARRSIRDKPLAAQCDQREIRYYIGFDMDQDNTDGTQGKNLGLVRRELKTLRQAVTIGNRLDEVDTDLYASEIGYIRFRYFDGVDWINKWHVQALPGQNSLPQAVEITVGYDRLLPPDPDTLSQIDTADGEVASPEPFSPDRFTVVARIPQADVFFGSRMARAQAKLGGGGLGGALDGGGLGGGLGGGMGSGSFTGGSLFDNSSSSGSRSSRGTRESSGGGK